MVVVVVRHSWSCGSALAAVENNREEDKEGYALELACPMMDPPTILENRGMHNDDDGDDARRLAISLVPLDDDTRTLWTTETVPFLPIIVLFLFLFLFLNQHPINSSAFSDWSSFQIKVGILEEMRGDVGT